MYKPKFEIKFFQNKALKNSDNALNLHFENTRLPPLWPNDNQTF